MTLVIEDEEDEEDEEGKEDEEDEEDDEVDEEGEEYKNSHIIRIFSESVPEGCPKFQIMLV